MAYLYFITFEASGVALMVRDDWDRCTTAVFEASILAVARFFPYHLLLPHHTHTHTPLVCTKAGMSRTALHTRSDAKGNS